MTAYAFAGEGGGKDSEYSVLAEREGLRDRGRRGGAKTRKRGWVPLVCAWRCWWLGRRPGPSRLAYDPETFSVYVRVVGERELARRESLNGQRRLPVKRLALGVVGPSACQKVAGDKSRAQPAKGRWEGGGLEHRCPPRVGDIYAPREYKRVREENRLRLLVVAAAPPWGIVCRN